MREKNQGVDSRFLISYVSVLLFTAAGVIAYYFLGGFIWGAGYAPTSSKEIDKVAELLDLKQDDTFYDLGCGYGRMIFAIAKKYDINCVGVEIDPIKCWWIGIMIRQKKIQPRVRLVRSDFLQMNLKDVRKVFVFLSKGTDIMKRLRDKMFQEMQQGSPVVSYVHPFDDWPPDKKVGPLYLYTIPDRARRIEEA